MSTLGAELKRAIAQDVSVGDDSLAVDLDDGRTIVVPTSWFPRLMKGTPDERANFRLIGGGTGIHWPDLDEDISIASLLAGRRSGETQGSLQRWLLRRGEDPLSAVGSHSNSFEVFCQRLADCIEPWAVLKTNFTVGDIEVNAVVEGQERQPDVLIEFKRCPQNIERQWLDTERRKMLSVARAYQKAFSRQPRLVLLIAMEAGDVSLDDKLQQTSALAYEYESTEFPLRIEFMSDSAIPTLTCGRVQSLLYE